MIFSEVNESVRAYKVGNHQHIPEIKQYLELFGGSKSSFSLLPHLLPVTRGIYTTIHALVKNGINEKDINNAFNSAYSPLPLSDFCTCNSGNEGCTPHKFLRYWLQIN